MTLGNQNAVKYPEITKDEVNYWFDVLEDNSLTGIQKVTGIHKDKISKILNERFR